MASESTAPSKVQDVIDLVKRLCLAEMAVSSYSPGHPFARKTVREAYDHLAGMLDRNKEPVVISATGRNLVFEGMPLEENNPVVAKLAQKLEEFRLENLYFSPGLSGDEFIGFFDILGKGAKAVNADGGVFEQMKRASITHIEPRSVSFVMLGEDQKVVDKGAAVVDGETLAGLQADQEVARYMISQVMKEAADKKWLINEIKNNPTLMAQRITEGIDMAVSRAETGLAGDDAGLEGMLENLRIAGQSIASENVTDPASLEELEQNVLSLEREVRARTSKLTSSKVARGLINEILSIVTTYSDNVKASRIAGEIVRGETNLKKTEKLLRDIKPKAESAESFLLRIQGLLKQRGMKEDQIEGLLSKSDKPRKRAKPRAPDAEAVTAEIRKELSAAKVEGDVEDTIGRLYALVDKKAHELGKAYRVEAGELREKLKRLESLVAVIPLVLWSEVGVVELASPALTAALGWKPGDVLTQEFLAAAQSHEFPLKIDADELEKWSAWSDAERRLLFGISTTIKDKSGRVVGAQLNVGG